MSDILLLLALTVPAQTTPAAPPALLPQSFTNVPMLDVAAPKPVGGDAAAEVAESLQKFDPQALTTTWSKGSWLLKSGDLVLKDFGRREGEARGALRIIRELQLTQRGTIGSPNPLMEYWLANGQAPQGSPPGLQMTPLDPATLRVVNDQAQWLLRDDRRVLFNFGLHADDARQALAVIRKYGFTEVGAIGQTSPSMLVFVKRPDNGLVAAALKPATLPTVKSGATDKADPSSATSRAEARLQEFRERHPGAAVDAVVQPAVRTLRAPAENQPPFGSGIRQFPPEETATNRRIGTDPLTDRCARQTFDWRRVDSRKEGGDWKLAAGSVVLGNFGADEHAARQALAALHHYRLTEQIAVGSGPTRVSYFLVNGQAPRGVILGVATTAFVPDALKISRTATGWGLCVNDEPLFTCESESTAKELLAAIKHHQFDRMCHFGPATPGGMTVLARAW